ncbi:DUF4062 domain-containing protein [Priestia megaterium]|uniref:DUF4062 domain-containing protein n=1 Tax=Priestia megaterium TaxID=1404 RepID=UPI001D91447C|nr:DUF4062 domain-containing protein [Priestia megaterium]CAH0318113.1 hypothetical protein SRABI82_05298 [Priestia megaterium]
MLTPQEINLIVYKYIGVKNGYLGDFSYKTHREFYPLYCGLDINPEVIQGTTRQRFTTILSEADDLTQAAIIEGIFAKYPISWFPERVRNEKQAIKAQLDKTLQRLKGEKENILIVKNPPYSLLSQKKLQVFISSTYLDLKDERQEAVEAILRNNHIPAGMELFQAASKSQFDIIKQWIEESDIYMLILGGRYGSIEPISGYSYTELEYHYALEANKPVFSIILSDSYLYQKRSYAPTYSVFEEKEKEKYETFKNLVKQKMIREIHSLQDIKAEVGYSIRALEQDPSYNFRGWIRPNDFIDNNTNHKSSLKNYNIGLLPFESKKEIIDFSQKKALSTILTSQNAPNEEVSAYSIKENMKKEGHSLAEINIAIRKLVAKGILEIVEVSEYNGDSYSAYKITEIGENWILENEEQILA